MEIKVGTALLDLEGKPLLHPESKETWTVGLVMLTMALGAPPQGATYTESEQVWRHRLAVDLNAALKDGTEGTLDLAPEYAIKIKEDVVRSFGPIVAGQMIPLLNGSPPTQH